MATADNVAPTASDPSRVSVSARYQLPTHIWVDSTVLGTVSETRIGGVTARVHVPQVGADGRPVPPTLDDVPADALIGTDIPWTRRYAAVTDDPRATALCVVALELAEDPRAPLVDVPYTDGTPEHRAITAAGTTTPSDGEMR